MDWIGVVVALGIAFVISVGTLGLFLLVALAMAAIRMVR